MEKEKLTASRIHDLVDLVLAANAQFELTGQHHNISFDINGYDKVIYVHVNVGRKDSKQTAYYTEATYAGANIDPLLLKAEEHIRRLMEGKDESSR